MYAQKIKSKTKKKENHLSAGCLISKTFDFYFGDRIRNEVRPGHSEYMRGARILHSILNLET
jgi:hypothetical protein